MEPVAARCTRTLLRAFGREHRPRTTSFSPRCKAPKGRSVSPNATVCPRACSKCRSTAGLTHASSSAHCSDPCAASSRVPLRIPRRRARIRDSHQALPEGAALRCLPWPTPTATKPPSQMPCTATGATPGYAMPPRKPPSQMTSPRREHRQAQRCRGDTLRWCLRAPRAIGAKGTTMPTPSRTSDWGGWEHSSMPQSHP